MPRYHFHVLDGVIEKDTEGTLLHGMGAVRKQAVQAAAQMLKEHGEDLWDSQEMRLEVTDDNGLILLRVDVLASESAAVSGG